MKQQIGISTVSYHQDGSIQSAMFVPTIKIDTDESLLKQLAAVQDSGDLQTLKQNSQLVFSNWFRKMDQKLTDIELSDRERFEIVTQVLECKKYRGGKIKKCSVSFIFQEIPSTIN